MKLNKNQHAFLELVKAGLWEQKVRLLPNEEIDYSEVLRLAQEQSVVGLVAVGLEHADAVPYEIKLKFIGLASQIQQRNEAMNRFIAELVQKMQSAGITPLLVKGQGVAQCYERALWRTCGDVDFLLNKVNYDKAKIFLAPMASEVEDEYVSNLHQGYVVDSWNVELHGTLRSRLWKRIDKTIDELQESIFYDGAVRSWENDKTRIFMPRADEDVVYVFSHILQHFFRGGIGIRQICDWCRLLWTYKDSLNRGLLESRIKRMGLMSEWRAFGAFAVEYLGMPEEAMPLFNENDNQNYRLHRKAEHILDLVLKTGNFGHNIDMSYQQNCSLIVRKTISFLHITRDSVHFSKIFPLDSIKVWYSRIKLGY